MDEDLDAVRRILQRVEQKTGGGAITSPVVLDLLRLARMIVQEIVDDAAARAL